MSVYAIEIPVLPETALGHALGFVELLRAANLLASLRHGPRAPRFGWRFVDAQGRPLAVEDGLLKHHQREGAWRDGPAQARFVAPLLRPDVPAIRAGVAAHAALSRRLAVALDAGQLVCTLGNAAWFAAASGRLAAGRVCLPWFYMAGFHRDHAGIALAAGEEFCEHGLWLSAALPAGLDLMVAALARRALGADMAQVMLSALRSDPERERVAAQATRAQHIPATRDSTLARAIAHLEQRVDQPYDLAALARAAAVSPRTLLRHFQQELGHSPLDHLHRLRCARARVLLEITLESVPTIAQACGYSDPAAFRRVFARHVGETPTAYRQRRSLRAPRKRWRVEAG